MMKKILPVVIVAVVVFIAAHGRCAAASPPTEESIRELLDVMEWRKTLDDTKQTMDAAVQASMTQALASQGLSDNQEKIVTEMTKSMNAVFEEIMNPEEFESMYVEIYRNALTQQEVEGMIAFYKTPVGRSWIEKMPVIMKQTMEVMQRRMQLLFPKLQEIQNEMIHRMREGK